ncbi:hypothetical protein [Desulfotomaculum sp. 1211_IL3151]|uniref:hypothetical protein n=1 Tax=Desulfotomaculum sp. 1211_IL3151 TaxID=3084055 RepID=UPI002FD888CD
MKRMIDTFCWFLGLVVIAKLLFNNQSLGYFWFIIAALSVFFGCQSGSRLELAENASVQIAAWLKNYQELSYYKQQLYLSEVINNAIRSNQTKQALEFLDLILKAEPDNETAKTLMVSIWGAELIST